MILNIGKCTGKSGEGHSTVYPRSKSEVRGLNWGLSVVSQARVRPEQLLDGHPGVPGAHGGCVDDGLHHQAGQQGQET